MLNKIAIIIFCYPIKKQQMFYLRIFISDGFCSFCWPRSFTEPKKDSGPLNHIEEDVFLFASNPCEASSAGFILDEHCCSHVSAAFG